MLIVIGFIVLFCESSCSRNWLDEKPSKNLVVPETLKDLQAILDNEYAFNSGYCYAPIISSPFVYVSDNDLGSLLQEDRDMYAWSEIINYEKDQSNDWNFFFKMIEYTNLVLEGVKEFEKSHVSNEIEGQAHFFRGMGYYHLAQIFCKPYNKLHANTDLGLPLRLSSNVNRLESRSNLQEVYDLILSDLKIASNKLAYEVPNNNRASKIAALAMLAKTKLLMGDFVKARDFSDSVLNVKPELLDYNNTTLVSHGLPFKFPYLGVGNPEIIFFAMGFSGNHWSGIGDYVQVSPSIYSLYSDHDRRKEFYFTESEDRINFVGSYSGDRYLFQGISVNEMYFIRSECNARLNNTIGSLEDLNLLLVNRFENGFAPNISEEDPSKLLTLIISEKRKEFPRFSNIWWEDLRRLNLEPEFETKFDRVVEGKLYSLLPNSNKYIFPIPLKEINLSKIEQNER